MAKAYKMCEIMKPTDLASSNFLPRDFSQAKTKEQKLHLRDGAKLGNEMQILITKQIAE